MAAPGAVQTRDGRNQVHTQAGAGPAEVDDDKKKSREPIKAEMSPNPRQPKRQRDNRYGGRIASKITYNNHEYEG